MLNTKELLHQHYSYNCLTKEQFDKFIEEFGAELEEGVAFPFDGCDSCPNFYAPGFDSYDKADGKRCGCGNRRVCIYYDEKHDFFYAEAY